MDEQAIIAHLAQWCFTPRSLSALQFLHNIEHIKEIKRFYPLRASVYLILPHEQDEKAILALCQENHLYQLSPERSRAFLEEFLLMHSMSNMSWSQLMEDV